MSTRDSVDRFFEAVIERQESAFEAIRGANERYHRFTRSLLEGARTGAHEWSTVGRRWAEKPTDLIGLYESISETMANSQSRRIALWQEFLDDLAESQREGQEVMRRSFGEVREAVERVQENIPSFLRARVPSQRRDEEAEPVAQA